MTAEHNRENDWMLDTENPQHTAAITPRVLLVEPNGYIPMLNHRGWLGLLGGHFSLEESETAQRGNLLDPDVVAPTIIRETIEEGGVDIAPFMRNRSAMLGFAEVRIIDKTRHTITDALTPVMICRIPADLPFNGNIVKVPPRHVPAQTYPDAAMALIHVELMRRRGTRGPIMPDWLNGWGEVIFINHPEKRYIKGAPPLHDLGLAFRPPPIPRNYPPDIKRWLRTQYGKM